MDSRQKRIVHEMNPFQEIYYFVPTQQVLTIKARLEAATITMASSWEVREKQPLGVQSLIHSVSLNIGNH